MESIDRTETRIGERAQDRDNTGKTVVAHIAYTLNYYDRRIHVEDQTRLI